MKPFRILLLAMLLSGVASAKNPKGLSQINMLVHYGQSLSVGGLVFPSDGDFKNTLSFVGGGNEWASNVDINDPKSVEDFYGDGFIPFSECKNGIGAPVGACLKSWIDLLQREDGVDLSKTDCRFVTSTPGLSGAPIESFEKGTPVYERMLFSVRKAKEFSDKMGKTFCVPCMFWVQGEGNTGKPNYDDYKAKLLQLSKDANEDIKAITGQESDVVFFTYQMAPSIR